MGSERSGERDFVGGYELLASAVAGRELAVALLHEGEGEGRSYTDGHTVFVPRARLPEAWLDVSLQALLVRSGSLATDAVQALFARPERARGYLACELARALALHGALLPRRVQTHVALATLPAATRDLAHSLARARSQARSLAETPRAWGVLLPGRVLRAQPRPGTASPEDSGTPRARIVQRDEAELETSRVLAGLRAPFEGAAGLLGKLMAKLLDLQPSPAGAAESGASGGELELLGSSAQRGGQRVLTGTPRSGTPSGPLARAERTVRRYPEWDARRRRYRHDWVHVAEVEPHPDNAPDEPLLPARDHGHALRRRLLRLCLGYESRGHQRDGADVRIDELVRLRLDALSGHAADERIYRAALRTRHDLGVLVLLDITGSTGERASDGVSVFERQLALALTLTEALHEAGDRVACYGFHGWGRKLVRFQRLLSFGERPGAGLRRRAAWVAPVGYSRLGAAVRHGATILRRDAGTPQRLLLVISDGVAYDQGYEGEHARADTRRALEEVQASEIACVCLSVGAELAAREHAELFGAAHYLALPRLAGHERALTMLLERAVAGASRRKVVGARR